MESSSILDMLSLRGLLDIEVKVLCGHQWCQGRSQGWKPLCGGLFHLARDGIQSHREGMEADKEESEG